MRPVAVVASQFVVADELPFLSAVPRSIPEDKAVRDNSMIYEEELNFKVLTLDFRGSKV